MDVDERWQARPRELWFDARPLGAAAAAFLERVDASALTAILAAESQLPLAGVPAHVQIALATNENGAAVPRAKADILVVDARCPESHRDFPGPRALYGALGRDDHLARFVNPPGGPGAPSRLHRP